MKRRNYRKDRYGTLARVERIESINTCRNLKVEPDYLVVTPTPANEQANTARITASPPASCATR